MLVAIKKAKLSEACLQQDDRRNEWDYGTSHRHRSFRCHLIAITI